jgi:hypothetical protein
MKKQQEDYGDNLQAAHDRWENLYEHGGADPFWPDGGNLNLVRNHILYYRSKIEESMPQGSYPAVYFKEVPQKVDPTYMARADEIRAAAKASLSKYLADPDYLYIVRHYDDLSPKTREKLRIDNVIGYATGLERSIQEDKLVDMRRHEDCERYLPAFRECADRMRQAPQENVQQSLFLLFDDLPIETDDDDVIDEEEYDEPEAETVDGGTAQDGEQSDDDGCIVQVEKNGVTLTVEVDEYPRNPRTYRTRQSTMYCWQDGLGDEGNPYSTRQDFESDKDLQDKIFLRRDLYGDGCGVSSEPYSEDRATGRVVIGVIFATQEAVWEDYRDTSNDTREYMTFIFDEEIACYNDYLSGECYRYRIEAANGQCVDCGVDFFGNDREYVIECMKDRANEEYRPLFNKALERLFGAAM